MALLGLVLEMQQSRGPKPMPGDSWIRRRVERIELVTESLVRRRISVDLALPAATAGGVSTTNIRFVPLTWLLRDNKLREFDLRDEEGRSIAVATREQGAWLAVRALEANALGLTAVAAEARGETPPSDLHEDVKETLRALVFGSIDERRDALAVIERAGSTGHNSVHDADFQRAQLMADRTLAVLIGRLIEEFILLGAVAGGTAQERRVLKLTWVEQARERLSLRRWLTSRMGWSVVSLRLPLSQLDAARSYHVEMASPSDDIEILWAAIEVGGICRRIDDEDPDPAHLVLALGGLPVAPVEPAALQPSAMFTMRLVRGGFLRMALYSCALSCLLIGVGRWRLDDLTRDVESAATLLLFVPGLLSLYVVRPGEHRLATELFSGVRLMVVSCALAMLLAGVLVILDIDPVLREQLWTSLFAGCILATIAVAWSNFGPSAPCPTRGLPMPGSARYRDAETEKPELPADARGRRRAIADARWFRRVIACVAYVFVLASCLLGPMLSTGFDRLSVQGRLQAQIADAARRHDPLRLDSFARVPWTRMYAFEPKDTPQATRAMVAKAIGADRVAAGEDRGRDMSESVDEHDALLVLVDRGEVAEVMAVKTAAADVTDVLNPAQCYLVPSDEVTVDSEHKLSVSKRTPCPR